MRKLFAGFSAAVIVACSAVPSALAHDHQNLEEGLPVEVEDAYPIAYRGREIQSVFRYDRTREDENRFLLEPRVEFGIAPNTQVKLRVPFYVGNADRTGSGDIGLGVLYNFNTESLVVPAFAISAEGDIPTGKSSRGFDTSLKLIATKTISNSGLDRLHLNIAWKRNAGADRPEREHRYTAILGYSRRLGPDTTLVADFVREQEQRRGENANIVEVGLRRQITPLSLVAIGFGAGIGEDSPKFRAIAGFQKSF